MFTITVTVDPLLLRRTHNSLMKKGLSPITLLRLHRPAPSVPRSAAGSPRTPAASGALRPTAANSTGHVSPAGRPSSLAVAAGWLATSGRECPVPGQHPHGMPDFPGFRRTGDRFGSRSGFRPPGESEIAPHRNQRTQHCGPTRESRSQKDGIEKAKTGTMGTQTSQTELILVCSRKSFG